MSEGLERICDLDGAGEGVASVPRGWAEEEDMIQSRSSSDHWASVRSTLAGLEKNSAKNPGKPPLYIHVSGCGIISDNVRGEKVDFVREWTDVGLDLNNCPPDNTHLESDVKIVEAGTRTENPVRTIILFPGQIYGIGEGVQKTTLWVRVFLDVAKNAGHCGTWGPGEISQSNIHVKDMATAIVIVLDAALHGKAQEGADGLYFAVSPAPLVTYHDWSVIMGDILYKKGLVKEGGARPFPPEITEPWGHYGWSLLASNQRARPDKLMQLGWQPQHSARVHLRDVFPDMVEAALADYEVQAKFAFR
ncbi:hypothetical protein OF83DRAFT_1165265 [Amylostereum chailletii]|nr:hypothetical protein OF83DRAFT_1165265 [Amylostereum chailletii]